MEKKKLIVLLAVLLLAGAAASAGIYAYLSAEDSQVNRFTFGQNVIETEEEFPTPDPKPGDSIEKKVRVKNTGDVPCFVRTQILFSNGDAESVSALELNEADWTERQEDGYHYYKHILPVGKSSADLLTAVKIADSAQLEELKDFQIIVYSESVQSEGYEEGQFREAFESLTH